MSEIVQWSQNNWDSVILVAGVAVSVLNAVTRHYGESGPGLRRILALFIDILSLIVSRDSPGLGGPLGRFKIPGQASPKPAYDLGITPVYRR
jgi:hypothetical protein